MKILLVSHKYPPYSLGGVEVYTYHLARALCKRHEVAVFFRHDGQGGPILTEHDEEEDGILTRRVSSNPAGLKATVAGEFFDTFLNGEIEASFTRFVGAFQPDLVHVQHLMALSARLMHIARESNVPRLMTLHDYWFICGNSQLIWPDAQVCQDKAGGMNCVRCAAAARFPSRAVQWMRPMLAPLFLYRDRIVRRAALQAQRLISPSHFLIDRYIEEGFPADRFTYLENGLPTDHLRNLSWQPSNGPLRVTFLGSLAWQKGVHVLAEAFNALPPGTARLRIWGDPAVFSDYVDGVRRFLTHPDVEWMGRIANERVGEVLADSDVMVAPSVWYENSPIVIQEARAAGVPVVASGHGALAEKVRHEIDGLLFPPGDAVALRQALLRLVEEPDLLPRLRMGIPPPADMDEHMEQLEMMYRQVVQR